MERSIEKNYIAAMGIMGKRQAIVQNRVCNSDIRVLIFARLPPETLEPPKKRSMNSNIYLH
jgi:hypothetical protein